MWMFRYSNLFRTSVEFSTRPALGSACVHSNTLVPGIAVTALHGTTALLFAAQMATMTGPSLPATAGPWMCAAVTLPLSHRANTTPNTVMRGDFSGSPSTRLRTKTPDGFVSAFAAEPVAWLSSKMGRDPDGGTNDELACVIGAEVEPLEGPAS